MAILKSLIIFTITLILNYAASENLSENEQCVRGKALTNQIILCNGLNSINEDILPLITPKTHHLIIRSSEEPLTVTSKIFQNNKYQHLTSVKFSDNKKIIISENGFAGLYNLQLLEIFNTTIKNINSNSFTGLSALEDLYLTDDHINIIEIDAFVGLKTLNKLSLARNNISDIQPSLFKDLLQLKFLDLKSNKIKSLQTNSFSGLENLEFISLDYNEIENIQSNVFDNLVKLTTLTLNSNNIQEVTGQLNLPELMTLELRNNKLRNIPKDFFEKLPKIKDIQLSENDLSDLNSEPFQHLQAKVNLYNSNVNVSKFFNLGENIHTNFSSPK